MTLKAERAYIKLIEDFQKGENKILDQLTDMAATPTNYKKMRARILKLKAGRIMALQDRKARLFELIEPFNLL